jgi:membrane fusion protein, multidrug efflux system
MDAAIRTEQGGEARRVPNGDAPVRERTMEDRLADQVGAPDERGRGSDLVRSPKPRRRPLMVAGSVLLGVLLIGGAILYWLDTRDYVSTDDAQIAGDVTQVSARIAGRVTRILFADNQHVSLGQNLLELDPRDQRARLDQALAQQANAAAQLKQARAQLDVRKANLDQATANVEVADADLYQARRNFLRFHRVNPAAITQQQIDDADAAMRSQTARLAAAQQAVQGDKAEIEVAEAQVSGAEASVKSAAAETDTARLQLTYTTIAAPAGGRVTHRTVNVGDYVQPGQALFALVHDRLWVQADFKETQLAQMRPGQPVTIAVDALPGVMFHGRVDSLQGGTGSQFSALPAENATGNWVKIVQRLPVKITFDDDAWKHHFLAPGMSVEPSVKVR